MELIYSVTVDDYWRFSKFLTRKTPALWVRWAMLLLVVPISTLYVLWATGVVPDPNGFLVWLVANILWILFALSNYKRQSLARFRQSPGTVGRRSLQIGSDALVSSSDLIQTRIDWKAIVRVWDSPVGVLFFYARLLAILVPISAFTRTGERETLVRLATAYWRHAQFGDPLPDLPSSALDTSIWPPPPRSQFPA